MQRFGIYRKTAYVLARCFIRAIARGPSTNVPKEIQRVCVVQTAKMGDMVCTTPLFRAIKNTYPQAQVFVVGDNINKDILADNPDIDGYVVWHNDYQQLVQELLGLRVDFACLTTPNFFALAGLYLSGIPAIAAPKVLGGWSPLQTAGYKLVRTLVLSVPHTMGQYAPREYLRLLEPIGITTTDTAKHLQYSQTAKEQVAQFLARHALVEKKFAIISPSAGNKIKRWPANRFAEVAQYLVQKGLSVVVIGGKRDKEEVEEMFFALQEKNNHIINALGQFSIDELKACISQAALFVSVDTGPLYIAEAFGVPTVDIVGPMDENEQPPRGPKHAIVLAPNRSKPQLHIMSARLYDSVEAERQTEAITTQAVINAVESVLQS